MRQSTIFLTSMTDMLPPRKKRRTGTIDSTAVSVDPSNELSPTSHVSKILSTGLNKSPQDSSSLHVRGLPASTTSKDLELHFSQSFPVRHATAILDPKSGECRGYGFVSFVEAEDARIIKDELDGTDFSGSKIKITFAKIRQRNAKAKDELDTEIVKEGKEGQLSIDGGALPPQPSRLIVRNLPWNVRQNDELAVLFRSYGKVKSINIPSKKSGLMSGFAFVTMRGRKNAAKAMDGVNGKNLHGRTLAVDWAIDRDRWQELNNEASGTVEEKLMDMKDGDDGSSEPLKISDERSPKGMDSLQVNDKFRETPESEVKFEVDKASQPGDRKESAVATDVQNNESTLFIRNLPFGCIDDELHDHFENFGRVRYARVVFDHTTGQSKGTGFVCFRKSSDARSCLSAAPRIKRNQKSKEKTFSNDMPISSVIQDDSIDTDGRFTMEGRVLQVSQAVGKTEATHLKEKGIELRKHRERDKRHVYLLGEGTITSNSSLYQKLSPSEIAMRESSAKQRKALVDKNPSLHLSLVRLSVRNIPRHVTSKDLKTLARDAVVGFATDVKQGTRQSLSKEELGRAADEMRQSEKERKTKGKGLVKQAKIVYEGREGGKVREDTGGGRSRGYGFIEYYTHRSALMGLRWLNGHAISQPLANKDTQRHPEAGAQERTRRLIVEFAIENAQVVRNRKIRENKAGAKYTDSSGQPDILKVGQRGSDGHAKRKRDATETDGNRSTADSAESSKKREIEDDDEKKRLVKRQQIIARKRMARRIKKRAGTSWANLAAS